MNEVVYRIVEHDGGWAYKLGDVFSETFPTRADAEAAADRAAAEQAVPGETETISWQDEAGRWHEETEPGSDRPKAIVAGHTQKPDTPAAPPIDRKPLTPLLILAGVVGALAAVLVAGRNRPIS